MGHHRRVAAKYPEYVPTANAGDCTKIAHLLKMARYYTSSESAYAQSMVSKKAQLDRTLGPAK